MDSVAAVWHLAFCAEWKPRKLQSLESALGSVKEITDPRAFLLSLPFVTSIDRSRIEQVRIEPFERARKEGAELLTRSELGPSQVNHPQPALFAWGRRELLSRKKVAIVGTRGASTYGKAAAHKFAEALAQEGVCIVSGGALGIDAAAHHAALDLPGGTLAVLASGLDVAYPAVHRSLFKNIRERGLLLSAFGFGMMPRKGSFLERNAIVAALADAVLVIEAPESSGSISTARAATDFGRQVFVLPANITMESFRGSHDLIRHGATLVDHPNQILEDIGLPTTVPLSSRPVSDSKVLSALTVEPLSTERIAAATGMDTALVLSELTMLELDGKVVRVASGYALRP